MGRIAGKMLLEAVFDSLDILESHLEVSLREMKLNQKQVHSIVAWPWIINSLLN